MSAAALPHDPEAESAALGAVLAEADRVMPMLMDIHLHPADFYEAQHRKIYAAVLAMHSAGTPIDCVTVSRETGLTITELDLIMQTCPTWTHGQHYAEQVIEASRKQRIVELADAVQTYAQDGKSVSEIREVIQMQMDMLVTPFGNADLFPCLRFLDLQNYEPPPNYSIAGEGWLRRGAGCLLTGGTGIGKTVLAEQIAASVASEVNILGCLKVHGAHQVMYVGAEQDEETMKRDYCAIVKHDDGNPCPVLLQANLRMFHAYGIGGDKFAAWLRDQVKKHHPDLIVIDPYQGYLDGETDINSTASFLSWIQPIDRLIREGDCALLLVAHTPKPRDRESWAKRESVYMAAGTSAISNWARTSVELTVADEDAGRYRLRFGKNAERNGMTNEHGGIVRDLFIEHSGSMHEPYWRVSDQQDEPTNSKLRDKIVSLAIEHPSMSQREIARQVECSLGAVSKWYPRKDKTRP